MKKLLVILSLFLLYLPYRVVAQTTQKYIPLNKEWSLFEESAIITIPGEITDYSVRVKGHCIGCGVSDVKVYYMGNRILGTVGYSDGALSAETASYIQIVFRLRDRGRNEECLDKSDRLNTKYKLAFSYYKNGKKYVVGIPSKYLKAYKGNENYPSDPVPLIPERK